jgi:hypothetical protein
MIILGVPLLSGQMPWAERVWIDGVYRSKRRPPRRIQVEEDESVGVLRLLGEGEGSFERRGMGRAFFRRAKGAVGGLRSAKPRNLLQLRGGKWGRLFGARSAWREYVLRNPLSQVRLLGVLRSSDELPRDFEVCVSRVCVLLHIA